MAAKLAEAQLADRGEEAGGKPGLVAELLGLAATHAVEWVKVRGHADNPGNNRCDELARGEIRQHAGVEKR